MTNEVKSLNAEGRRFARQNEGIRVARHSNVFGIAEIHGSPGFRQTSLRSGTSVGANYREAHRARSKLEFIAKCGDSLRELEESAYWLELLLAAEIVSSSKLEPLQRECSELIAIFVTIVKRSKQQ